MQKITVSLILFAAINTMSAFAACGGGGHTRPVTAATPAATPAPIASMSSSREFEPTNVAVENRVPAAVPIPKLNTYTFDSLVTSGKLQLSWKQERSVEDTKAEIRGQLDKVGGEYNRSFSALQACHGECYDQRKNLDRATAVMQSYRPNATFDSKVSKILSPEQMEQYTQALRSK